MTTRYVWYAAYGSNCCDTRFGCYLAGGRPAGSTKHHHGCRDTTPPTHTAAIRLDYPVYFGGWSPYWGGAIAYLDPIVDLDAATLAVARRITVGQFGDIVAQECGGTALSADIPIDKVVATGRVDVGGVYGTVLYAGMRNSEPVLTCTSAARRTAGRPTDAYVDTIRRGLSAAHPGVDLDGYLDPLVATTPKLRPSRRRRPGSWRQPRLGGPAAAGSPIDVDRWEDLDLDDAVLDGDTWDDRAAINRYLFTTA